MTDSGVMAWLLSLSPQKIAQAAPATLTGYGHPLETFEVKAGTRVSGEELRGLRFLKDRLGPRLQEAVVLYTGEHACRHDGWIWILPVGQLWA